MELKLPPSGGLLPRPILDLPIRRKDKDPLAELHVDIGEMTRDFGDEQRIMSG